jgi:hypothetical protein
VLKAKESEGKVRRLCVEAQLLSGALQRAACRWSGLETAVLTAPQARLVLECGRTTAEGCEEATVPNQSLYRSRKASEKSTTRRWFGEGETSESQIERVPNAARSQSK